MINVSLGLFRHSVYYKSKTPCKLDRMLVFRMDAMRAEQNRQGGAAEAGEPETHRRYRLTCKMVGLEYFLLTDSVCF